MVHPNTKLNLVCQVETTGVVVRLNESSRPWDGSWHYCYMSADNFLHWFLWMLYCLKQGPPVKYWVQPGGGAFLSTPHWNWERKCQNCDFVGKLSWDKHRANSVVREVRKTNVTEKIYAPLMPRGPGVKLAVQQNLTFTMMAFVRLKRNSCVERSGLKKENLRQSVST